jgi:hypothetical protein
MNPMQMSNFFIGVKAVLKPGSFFFLQILHYDYIFREKVETLPGIENEFIKFERKYRFLPGSPVIRFITRLTIKASNEVIENETGLLGIGANDLTQLMETGGFSDIRHYADFQNTPFGGKHLPLVIVSQIKT